MRIVYMEEMPKGKKMDVELANEWGDGKDPLPPAPAAPAHEQQHEELRAVRTKWRFGAVGALFSKYLLYRKNLK